MPIFSLTIFLGALLLFQVELIIGKYILPWFGGTSAVWITCMLFFQVLLLGGYAYGHLLDSHGRSRVRAQTLLHRLLLLVSLLVLAGQFILWHSPLILDASWKPRAEGNPLLQILTLLAVSVGLPYLVLASTAPLLQSWWRRLYPQRSPYRLYAVSNFGSFLGLVSYPFLVEPFLTLKTQARLWSWGYVAFALGCAYCAFRAARAGDADALASGTAAPATGGASGGDAADAAGPQQRPAPGLVILWLSLAACASALLLATTNQLCKNVAAVPLLWVLPLAIYLLTFTLCFESDRRYSRKWFHPAFALGMFLVCFVLATGAGKNLPAQIAIYSFGLFAACMVCHGELARLKPDPRHLTLFYLVIAAGGVLGGLFVALAAPYLFLGYWEYEISLWLAALLFLVVLVRDRSSWLYSTRVKTPLVLLGAAALLPESLALAIGSTQLAGTLPSIVVIVGALFLLQNQNKRRKVKPAAKGPRASAPAEIPPVAPLQKGHRLLLASCAIVLLILGATFTTLAKASLGQIASMRNFYGALTIDRQNPADPERDAYALKHGEIVHGFEFRAPGKQLIPTSYFSEDSGLGLLLAPHLHSGGAALRVGDVGLGIGTVAAYARPGDSVRFYEINPQVQRLASDPRYFEFLHDSPAAPVDVVLGDGRLSLERELAQGSSQDYDVLVVDAFNGDAVPVHLLTVEAFELYLRRLKNPGGVLAVNVTNTFLDLRPVVVAAAEHLGLASVWVHCDGDERISYTNDWVLVSRDTQRIDALASAAKHAARLQVPESRLWTDDYSNLFEALSDKSRSSSQIASVAYPVSSVNSVK
jgi:spermidine synthase